MLNKTMLIGHTGKDAEVFTFEDGTKKASISLAVTESYKNKAGEKVDSTEWFNVVFFRGLAEVVEKFVKKGDKIFVEGKSKTRTYDKDGEKRYLTEIFATNMVMLGSKGSGSGASGADAADAAASGAPQQKQSTPEQTPPDFIPNGDNSEPDDLPF